MSTYIKNVQHTSPGVQGHSPQKVLWVCLAVKTPISSLISNHSHHLQIHSYSMIQFFRAPLRAKVVNFSSYKRYLSKVSVIFIKHAAQLGVEFCRELQESIQILLGGVCESLWTLLHSVCVKILTGYESLSGFSQINLARVFVRVDSRTRVEILTLPNLANISL